MIRAKLRKIWSVARRYPVISLVVAAVLISSLAYGLYAAIAWPGFTAAKYAPDAPMIIESSPKVIPKDTIPVAPTAVEPAIAKTPHLAVVPSAPADVSGLTPVSSGSGSSTTSSGATVSTGYTSSNWAGYFATMGGYTGISGTWTVPRPTGNGVSTSGDAAWIGIGGATTSDLIQVGTAHQVAANGQVAVAIFYEMLPASAIIVSSVTVSPGDVISASLTGSGNVWTIRATDVTTGQVFSITVNYTSSLSSAEWIEEDPSYSSGQLMPFDNFGSVTFSGGSATRSGVTANILALGAQEVTMVNSSGQAIATPSSLNGAGNGFSVTRN